MRHATVRVGGGRAFTLTPEALAIEGKTFKKSSKSRTIGSFSDHSERHRALVRSGPHSVYVVGA